MSTKQQAFLFLTLQSTIILDKRKFKAISTIPVPVSQSASVEEIVVSYADVPIQDCNFCLTVKLKPE